MSSEISQSVIANIDIVLDFVEVSKVRYELGSVAGEIIEEVVSAIRTSYAVRSVEEGNRGVAGSDWELGSIDSSTEVGEGVIA